MARGGCGAEASRVRTLRDPVGSPATSTTESFAVMGAPQASTPPSSPIPPAPSPPPIHVGLLLAFYTLEAAGLSCAMVLNRYWDRLPPHTFPQKVFFLAPLAVLFPAGSSSPASFLKRGGPARGRWTLTRLPIFRAGPGLF